ncbi:NAD(P)/FAD-dependent oxidoreductase [Burkholderia plantarii]|uniref:FAD dependent oxidoreductase n=1 Tax=Burkholderia plantarii TaxID=41899 RepID=A0A0B6S1P9_BURPL|nr:FAD-binding oxidoreductase [Burkholderia plantarii]AJK49593.1 FAD dependent oxidoreductase [Burkholderia plantarii]
MNEARHYHVAIAGGGLVGASTARALAAQGVPVALFERRFCGAQASGVNYGGVRTQGRPEEQLPLATRARRIWNRLPELIGIDGELVVSGHLRLARREADLDALHAWAAMASGYGVRSQVMSGDAFRRRYPWLGAQAIGGALCASDGHANPRLVSPAFAAAARRAGADLYEQTELSDVEFDGTRFVLQAGGRRVTADWLVNAAGAWGNTVAGRFGEAVPLRPIYPNMWVTEPLPPFIEHNLGVVGGGVYARQVARGNCVIGGGRGHGDGEYAQPSADTTRAVMREACALLPGLRDALLIRTWSGVEGETPDSNPVIGPSGTTPCLLHAFGFSGGGFLLAPGVGELLAELIVRGETDTPIAAFSIARFTAGADRASAPVPEPASGATAAAPTPRQHPASLSSFQSRPTRSKEDPR